MADLVQFRWRAAELLALTLAPVVVGAGALMINKDISSYPTLGDGARPEHHRALCR